MTEPTTISRTIAYQRLRNVGVIASAVLAVHVALCCVLAFFLAYAPMLYAVAGLAAASLFAVVLVRSGHTQSGAALLVASQLVGYPVVVMVQGELSVAPLLASAPVLIATATIGSRFIAISTAAALLSIATEGLVVHLRQSLRFGDWATLLGSVLVVLAAAGISMLHVKATERALSIAVDRDQQRNSAAKEAIASEERYRLIADNTDDLICLIDERDHALYLSPSYHRKLGIDWHTWSPATLAQFIHPDDVQMAAAAMRRAREQGQAAVELRVASIDGGYCVYESNLSRVGSEGGSHVVIISRDVTQRRKLEEQLCRAQRLEALGRMAGGVAHDFNNFLGVIAGASELAAEGLEPDSPVQADLKIVRDTVERATELTRQLLVFSRKQAASEQVVDARFALSSMGDTVQRLVGASIRADYRVHDDCPPVNVSKSQLEQIVMNFAVNARDAMLSGGTLHIELRRCTLVPDQQPGLAAGDYLEIAATDSGTGIPEEILPNLFEPFFTTKAAGRGTGLGLATCYNIATQCGGTIIVHSKLGEGSTFRALLPAARSPSVAQYQVSSSGNAVMVSGVREQAPFLDALRSTKNGTSPS